jgi:NADPH:quinone reductase-like Zn-dependent oxidoreductase
MDGTLEHGTLAQYAIVPADAVVAKPAALDYAAAACIPLAGTAAWAAVDAVHVAEGSTVLIAGASGGVGSYAIQLAATRGAVVIATGLPDDIGRLRGLGAAEIVDYRADVVKQVMSAHGAGIDALIDLVHFEADGFVALAAAVRDGGHVASALGAADPDRMGARGLIGTNIIASPVREALSKLVAEIERGAVRVDVEESLPLDEATKGLETLANGTARGKLVVTVD